jgi:hypothetical protein
MKITKKYLKEVIVEELDKLNQETLEENIFKNIAAGLISGALMFAPSNAEAGHVKKAKSSDKQQPKITSVQAKKPQQKQAPGSVFVDYAGVNNIDVLFIQKEQGFQEVSFYIPEGKGFDREDCKKILATAVGKKYGEGTRFMMYMPGAIDGQFSALIRMSSLKK